jgi:hypothetical protein
MTIDERVEALVMTAELLQKELDTLGSYLQTDAEHIRALVRIAEIHERRLEALENGQS